MLLSKPRFHTNEKRLFLLPEEFVGGTAEFSDLLSDGDVRLYNEPMIDRESNESPIHQKSDSVGNRDDMTFVDLNDK